MNVKEKIDKLRLEKDWSVYKLAKEIGVSNTAVYAWFDKPNANPSMHSIESVCEVFGMTLAEFYSDVDSDGVTGKELLVVELFRAVPDEQKDQVIDIIKSFIKK